MSEPLISVSRETLRAELADLKLDLSDALAKLELRLLDRLADKATVAALESRLANLEKTALVKGGPVAEQVHELDKQVTALTTWRNQLFGGFLLATTLGTVALLRIFFGIG